jgi:HD-GYP domain-containing protein (c-di-GMP phosphodiesterase class II)
MRYIPADNLKAGMELARTVYNKTDAPYLVEGTALTENYIDSIRRQEFSGLYINDEFSKDIEVISVVSDKLRYETVNVVKQLFSLNEKKTSDKQLAAKKTEMVSQINSIIDELLDNKELMINMIDLKCFDNYTYAHSVNVAVLSLFIGISMGFARNTLSELGLSAILHDIGKIFIAKEIINKPAKLTDEEFEEIKTHSFRGYEYARDKYRLPIASYIGILDHHEKWDGSGYPNKTNGKKISLFGRIISIADVYDALTSERPYRTAWSPSEAMEYISGNSGVMFDFELVEIFRKKIAPYPVGTAVILSNGYTAFVVKNYEEFCLRPKVRLIYDPEGNAVEPVEIDLHNDFSLLNVTITGMAK